ncbi:MAG TPA: NADH-ubiquinone oxidoreductase-F iron-sulfur binding region domain-containing protein [Planctomycetota bacterium]|nr:NADH-ubiquinone oxidoreductase-F iron-sulfur binding region domain-containing protein [Planctomycetota bacterium]
MERLTSVAALLGLKERLRAAPKRAAATLSICYTTGCRALGGVRVREAIERELRERGLCDRVALQETGCRGFCEAGPLVVVGPAGILYVRVAPEDVPEIIERTVLQGEVIERLLSLDPATGQRGVREDDVPFYKHQTRLVLRHCGHIDPKSVEDYLGLDGYAALAKVLGGMTPGQVVAEVAASGLRGRGGAGFPTGRKWELCRASLGQPKYLICNADEGDPGAFMDRSVCEADPHAVIEGMLIGAYAIGCTEGYIYCRAEYPIAIQHLTKAIADAEALGLLGDNILGSSFSFHLKIKQGAGAFVCGEETALIASIEGRRGMPRARPPFPAQAGLFGKPTNINNVETFACVPVILNRGAAFFASMGTEKSKGTKIFAVAGKVKNTGLVEVPMGATLRQIVFDIGGGILRDRKFKAAQTGGPSGGCIPAQYLDLPIDYDSLQAVGAIMGSGGLIVLDDATCMVELARFFLDFVQNESCGKCVPCRVGTRRMLEILTRITRGEGREGDVALLEEIAATVKAGSLCGLGQTAPNPVLSTIRYFRDEFDAHIRERRCPAAQCQALMRASCSHTCPAGVNVPEYVALIAQGRHKEAVQLIRKRNPFPSVCGRVCDRPCEAKCRRGDLDDSVSIRALKRFASDVDAREGLEAPPEVAKRSGKVAIVGAGPAGLTCGYFLGFLGRRVTVFDALPVAGGMLAVGIPAYRLPRDVLQREIDYICQCGVKLRLRHRVKSLGSLLDGGFDAVFLAVGAHKGLGLGLPGEEGRRVYDAAAFLRQFSLGQRMPRLGRVAVVGGGNAAIDSARTAVRLGAESVTVLYRRTRAEMPAYEEEVHEAIEEGVCIEYLVAPTAVLRSNGSLAGLECVRMQLGTADQSGRRRPVPIAGSEHRVEADSVIVAISQQPDFGAFEGELPKVTRWGTLVVDPVTMKTSMERVWAGGDCVSGAATVIQAIGGGQKAAMAIDKALGGEGLLPEDEEITNYAAKSRSSGKRPKPRVLSPAKRRRGFEEIVTAITPAQACREARRCLRCDLEED